MERRVLELKFLFLAAILLLVVCVSSLQDDESKQPKSFRFSERRYRSLVTNPVTTPSSYTPSLSPPEVVNIPSTNPIVVTPNPAAMPGTMPSATPVSVPNTNPVNSSPLPVTNPVTTPSTNPGVQPVSPGGLPGNVPLAPPLTTNAPAVPGQSWCVAKSGSLDIALQSALDYACGIGGVDCSALQQGASCFNPNSLEFHASYAFNSYYMKNPSQTSCDFGGTAMITNANPSSGSCIFPTASTSTSIPSPVTQNPTMAGPTPINPTPTTSSSSGATVPGVVGSPPFVMNPSNPASGTSGIPGISGVPGTSPASGLPITDLPYSPPGATTSISMSSSLQPFISGFLLVIFTLTSKHILDF